MIGDITQVPLSPPNSPRMSDGTTKQHDFQWHPPPLPDQGPMAQQAPPSARVPEHSLHQPEASEDANRPALQSYKSFQYTFGPSSRYQHDAFHPQSNATPDAATAERTYAQRQQPPGTSEPQPATCAGSAPTSPVSRLTPRSSGFRRHDASGDDEDIDIDIGEGDNEEEEERPAMTAAEIRAQKRKMKRFRLTHNQTRFLMSEFARQAHPDAAHRERLSREIPGLSPRQVQVWFQNRRAKLKRLTTDDRERMMRSRALPANFDMTQALHGPFGGPPTSAAPLPSPGEYGQLATHGDVRPLTLDTLRRVPDYEQLGQHGQQFASPTGITPALGQFGFTPPQSATSTMSSAMSSTMSPTSAAGGGTAFDFQQRSGAQESPRRSMYGMAMGSQHQYPPNLGHLARMQAHERFQRPHGEPISSPLRSSMSYTGAAQESAVPYQAPNRASSFSEQTSYPSERPQYARSFTNPHASPYGLGFSYSQVPHYQSNENTQPSVTSAASPQMIDMQQYRRTSGGHLAGPPTSSHYPYQPPNFATPQPPSYPGFEGAHFAEHDFSHPFQPPPSEFHRLQHPPRQQHQGQPGFAAIPGQQQFLTLGSSEEHGSGREEDGNSSDGGVPVSARY